MIKTIACIAIGITVSIFFWPAATIAESNTGSIGTRDNRATSADSRAIAALTYRQSVEFNELGDSYATIADSFVVSMVAYRQSIMIMIGIDSQIAQRFLIDYSNAVECFGVAQKYADLCYFDAALLEDIAFAVRQSPILQHANGVRSLLLLYLKRLQAQPEMNVARIENMQFDSAPPSVRQAWAELVKVARQHTNTVHRRNAEMAVLMRNNYLNLAEGNI